MIAPIQVAMTVSLAKVFGIGLSSSAAVASLATETSTILGRTASQVLLGWIPGIGNLVNSCTAISFTEAIGWMLAEEFARQSAECAA